MNIGWSSDFGYSYFRRILQAIKSNFERHLLAEGAEILHTLEPGRPKLILRHDVDVSLRKALRMAEIEHECGISATYMVMTNSPLYSVNDKTSRDILRQLITMGHEVALHFDPDTDERKSGCELNAVEAKIATACKHLEQITNQPVLSISFHRPMPQFLRGSLFVAGRVNAYARELMDWYLSDSKGYWREGEPLPKLLRPDKPLLQLLIHPFWWGDVHSSPEDRLQEFFATETQRQSRQYVEAFDADLAKTVPAVQRRGFHCTASLGGA